jgi:sec-independent protein translocase protein TatA
MGDVAKGIKSFKKGMAEEDEADTKSQAPKSIDHQSAAAVKSRSEAASKVEGTLS